MEDFKSTASTNPSVKKDNLLDSSAKKELDIHRFRQELGQFYLEDFCYVKTDPWDDSKFLLDRYFTNLCLNEEVIKGSGFLKKIPLANSHNDIFNVRVHDRVPNRILVFGEGGSGKTTLCKKLAYDWAKRDLGSPLKDIPVLCVLEFRKLLDSESIEEAIHRQLLSTNSQITPDQILRFIRANPTKIVIILDGFDEFGSRTNGDISDLLNSKIMAKVKVMVTTRPWSSCILQKKKNMYAQISLDGFDSTGIETYVRNYFTDEEIAQRCLAKIGANGALKALASTPIVLSMVCFVMKVTSEDIGQIDTLSKMLESFLRATFIKYIDKQRLHEQEGTSKASSVKDIKSTLQSFWNGLGKIALLAVNARKKKIFFNEDEFAEDSVRVIGLNVGFLLRHKSKLSRMDALESPMTFYSFPHLLFQEKCAGDYLASQNAAFDTLVSNMENRNEAFTLQYTLAFACGKETNVAYASKIMDRLIHIKENDLRTGRRPIIGKNKTDDLTAKFTEGIAGDETSLFNLALLVNHESQSKGKLLHEIGTIAGQTINHQLISGIICSPFLYFIDYALSDGMYLPSCPSITLTQSEQNIFLQDFVMRIFTVFSSVTRVGIARCPLQLKEPVGYTGCSLEAKFDDPFTRHIDDKIACVSLPRNMDFSFWTQPSRKELLLLSIPHPVSLADLTKSARVITPEITSIILKGLSIVMPTKEEINTVISHKMSSLTRLVLDNIDTSVSFEDCLHLTALCPNLSSLELYACHVDSSYRTDELSTSNRCVRSPEMILCSRISKETAVSDMLSWLGSHPGIQCLKLVQCNMTFECSEVMECRARITDVFLTDCGNATNITDSLESFGQHCKNLTLTFQKDGAVGVVGPGNIRNIEHHAESLLERLEVVCKGDAVSLLKLLMSTTSLCPKLERMHLEGNVVNLASLADTTTDKTCCLTSIFLKSIVQDITSLELFYLIERYPSLERLIVDDCKLVNSCHGANVDSLRSNASREIVLAFTRTRTHMSISDILEPVDGLELKKFVLCLSNCKIDVSQSLRTDDNSHRGSANVACGIFLEHCESTDSSISIQNYMSTRCPLMCLKENTIVKQIYASPGLTEEMMMSSLTALFSMNTLDPHGVSELDVALGRKIPDPVERSLIKSLYYDQTIL